MKKIKTLIVLPHMRTGGGQKLALDIALGLNKRDDFDVSVLCIGEKEDNIFGITAEENNLNVHYLGKKEGFSIKCCFDVFKFIVKYKPDIVNTHLRAITYVLMAAFIIRKPRYYHTVHNIAEKEAEEGMATIERIAYKYTGFMPVAISDYCKSTIVDYYGISDNKIPVIYNGIDSKRYSYNIPYEKRDDQVVRIISTGRMQPVKRHILMVQAFSMLHKKYPNTELVFLGDGELREDVEKEIRINDLEDVVKLYGVVEDVQNELNKAHIYLMASEYEGLPLSVLEAMSCGLPIVATKAGGTVDIVDDSNGFLCDIDDKNQIYLALEALTKDAELRKRMSNGSVLASSKYDISKCVDEYSVLFRKVIRN